MHRMVTVDAATVRTAWGNWLHYHRGLHCEETEERFFDYVHPNREDSFIDDCVDWDSDESLYYVLPRTAERLLMAASSNHHTIFKAYYVSHPWKQR